MSFKILSRLAGLAILVGAVFYLSKTLFGVKEQIWQIKIVPPVGSICLSAGLCALWLASMITGWRRLLVRHTHASDIPRAAQITRAYLLSFMSRYIPGKIWPAITRANILEPGVPVRFTLRSYIIEQIHLVASSAFLSIGIFLYYEIEHQSLTMGNTLLILAGCALTLTWLLFPQVIFNSVARIMPDNKEIGKNFLFVGSMKQWAFSFFIYIALSIIQGLAILPIWLAVSPAGLSVFESMFLVCAYAGARFAGQAAAMAPGGIGVREGAFVFFAAPLSAHTALVSALWLRAIASGVEITGFAIVFGWSALCRGRQRAE